MSNLSDFTGSGKYGGVGVFKFDTGYPYKTAVSAVEDWWGSEGDLSGLNDSSDLDTPIVSYSGEGLVFSLVDYLNTASSMTGMVGRIVVDGTTYDFSSDSIAAGDSFVIVDERNPIYFKSSFTFSAYCSNTVADVYHQIYINHRMMA